MNIIDRVYFSYPWVFALGIATGSIWQDPQFGNWSRALCILVCISVLFKNKLRRDVEAKAAA